MNGPNPGSQSWLRVQLRVEALQRPCYLLKRSNLTGVQWVSDTVTFGYVALDNPGDFYTQAGLRITDSGFAILTLGGQD